MPITSISCPICKRTFKNPQAGSLVVCTCGQRLRVPAAPAAAPIASQTRGPEPEFPWVRLLIVGGSFVAVMALLGVVALVIIIVDYSSRRESDSTAVAQVTAKKTPTTKDHKGKETNPGKKGGPSGKGNPDQPLRKAFDALGSRDKLEQIKVVQIKGKGQFTTAKNVNDITLTWQSIQRFKYVEKFGTVNMEQGFVLKGDQGWTWFDSKMMVLDKDKAGQMQLFAYSLSLSNLLPLKEIGFDLVKGVNLKVRNRNCYSMNVKFAGRPDFLLFFDEETNLLAKSEARTRFMEMGTFKTQDKDTLVEYYYSNYKKTNDVNHWWKVEQYRDGKRYADLELSNIQFFDKVDEAFFSVPGQ
jgi:hypothetical protein